MSAIVDWIRHDRADIYFCTWKGLLGVYISKIEELYVALEALLGLLSR
jgi:hypothetical protein